MAEGEKRVWKCNLEVIYEQVAHMPRGAELLSVDVQNQADPSTVQLWMLVEPLGAPLVGRLIRIAGTGNPLPAEPGTFIGTALAAGGSLVWHVFDGGEVE